MVYSISLEKSREEKKKKYMWIYTQDYENIYYFNKNQILIPLLGFTVRFNIRCNASQYFGIKEDTRPFSSLCEKMAVFHGE